MIYLIILWGAISVIGIAAFLILLYNTKRQIVEMMEMDEMPHLKPFEFCGFIALAICPIFHIFYSFLYFNQSLYIIELVADRMALGIPQHIFDNYSKKNDK